MNLCPCGCLKSGALMCAVPLTTAAALARGGDGPAPFTDEASVRGINYTPVINGAPGNGVALVDLDGDGDADLVATGQSGGAVGVYENDGAGYFTDRSVGSGIPASPNIASCVIAGDYDRDGDLDLYFARHGAPNILARNNGAFSFTDVSVYASVNDNGFGTGAVWADYDNDGWLDLYVANMTRPINPAPNRLYRNLGNGTFAEVANSLGVDDADTTWQSIFFDFDRDGDADLYISNDKLPGGCEPHNHLFENVGGSFVEITDSSGTEACAHSMGVAVGDFDGNGWQDLYCTGWEESYPLLMNNGDGTFVESSSVAGTGSFAVGWGAHFFDYNNDLVPDLYVCNADAANHLFVHTGSFPCVDMAPALGIADAGASYCVAFADIDDDGDLDFVMQNNLEPLRLFINHEGENRAWVKVDVLGQGPNRFAIGATVRIRTGSTWQMREVFGGGMYLSQNELVQHFGLNDQVMIDELEVMWPGGTTRTVTGYASNQTWTIYPHAKMCDGDQDGDVELDDFFAMYDCVTGSGAGLIAPGCEMFDEDGDGDVDSTDHAVFLTRFGGPLDDCNTNSIPDLTEIFDGSAADVNRNGVLDSCETLGDINGDDSVDIQDLLAVLAAWGPNPGHAADIDSDGVVSITDLLLVLSNWG